MSTAVSCHVVFVGICSTVNVRSAAAFYGQVFHLLLMWLSLYRCMVVSCRHLRQLMIILTCRRNKPDVVTVSANEMAFEQHWRTIFQMICHLLVCRRRRERIICYSCGFYDVVQHFRVRL
jgi:hypothetical protein